ncbi:hypothetical protein Ocin01_18905 [Orchesella cincta]|uniref:Uncharacterized protein n=1 Tax=Orchesella cincta TaxID=48709 RepID=A0A1D2M474_ORCCI|nr:hypothetical protein Ocin01_18905 [Orchesella cincta]
MVIKLEPDEAMALQKFKVVVGDLDEDDNVLIRFLSS